MKNNYVIASLGFTVLTTVAFAQIKNSYGVPAGQAKIVSAQPNKSASNNSVNRVESGSAHALIDYAHGDEIFQSTPFYYWKPALYMNMRYTVADSTDLWTGTNCTVVFDTLWDQLNSNFHNNVQSGSLKIDTIWALMAYHNTSLTNDTVIFQVNAVTTAGFPTSGNYAKDTLILNAGSLTYNDFSKLQLVHVVPSAPIAIPSIARHGWNFCINMEVYGSKMDTVGVWYFSKGTDCTLGGAITSAYTIMGVPDGRAPHVNSFVSGLFWFNKPGNHGNGSALTWPIFSGSNMGMCFNSGNYYWYDQKDSSCAGNPTDTSYFPIQDIAIYASVDYTDVTGINELASKDFSIGQNYPNPFNKSTEITYNLTIPSNVVFSVYDMTGRELVHTNYTTVAPGKHVITIQANRFTPGIYFYSFNVNGTKITRKMVITQ